MWLGSCHAASLAPKTGIKDGLMTGQEEISWDEEKDLSPNENMSAFGSKGIRGFDKFSPFPYESNTYSGKRDPSPNEYVPPFFSKNNKIGKKK